MSAILSPADLRSSSPTPGRPAAAATGLAPTPEPAGLLFAEAIGLLDAAFDQGEAGPTPDPAEPPELGERSVPADGGSGTATAEAADSLPAALTSPPFAIGLALNAQPLPTLPVAPVPDGETADAAVALAGTARPLAQGGLAMRMAALAAAGGGMLPRAASGDAAMPMRPPTPEAVGSDTAGERPAAVVARQPASDGLATGTPASSAEATPALTTSVAPAPALAADDAASPAIKLPAASPEQWRRPLLEALGDRIRVEIAKRGEHAVIRLDPPMMGHIEIVIRHEAGALQIQLGASNGEVLRQLQNISDSLRQDLAQRQYTDISVQVFAGSSDADGRRRPDAPPAEDAPGHALAEAETGQASASFVLATDRD